MGNALRILAVDNEPSVTVSLSYALSRPLYQVTAANSGDEALAKLDADAEPFDVIIVDQKMPNLTGLELVGALRERGVTSKIMVLSAQLSPEIRHAYDGMGVHTMFNKPFDVGELRAAVDCLTA